MVWRFAGCIFISTTITVLNDYSSEFSLDHIMVWQPHVATRLAIPRKDRIGHFAYIGQFNEFLRACLVAKMNPTLLNGPVQLRVLLTTKHERE